MGAGFKLWDSSGMVLGNPSGGGAVLIFVLYAERELVQVVRRIVCRTAFAIIPLEYKTPQAAKENFKELAHSQYLKPRALVWQGDICFNADFFWLCPRFEHIPTLDSGVTRGGVVASGRRPSVFQCLPNGCLI